MDTVSRNKMSEDVIGQMQELVSNHLKALKKEDEKVQETISKSDNAAEILTEAKDIAFDNAVSLFGPLQTLKELSEFLQDIIKIENNFNELYKTMKSSQEAARQKYAQNMTKYENSKVHIQNEGVDSFEKLIFRALIHVSTFNQLLNKIEAKCNANNIKLSNSGAQCKGMERAFYKTYYIYGNNDGYKQIKDVLRASLIFDSFDDLYKAFGIIDQMCPILRVKDRFNPKVMPFGYRDCLINFYCPTTKIIVELQLHLRQFYDLKKISHKMYKRARLFALKKNDDNMAYEYATKYIRPLLGDEAFYEMNKMDAKFKEEESIKDEDETKTNEDKTRPLSDGYYFIYCEHSGKALDIEGGSKSPGAKLIQFNIHGGDNQKFFVKFNEKQKKYTIQSKISNLYIDVGGASNDNMAEILQWNYHGGKNQLFEILAVGDNTYRVNTHSSGKVLDIEGGSALNCAKVIQYEWNGQDNQRFRFKKCTQPIDDGYYFICCCHAKNKVLDVEGGSHAKVAKIIMFEYHGGKNQQFYMKYEGDGVYSVKCRDSGLYWDIEGGNVNDGAKLIQVKCLLYPSNNLSDSNAMRKNICFYSGAEIYVIINSLN